MVLETIYFLLLTAPDYSQHSILQKDSVFTDPICKMKVASSSIHSIKNNKQNLRFCSKFCKEKFEKEPGKVIRETKLKK